MGALAAAAAVGCEARDEMDVFDELPDHLVLHILNLVGDARSLARCRPVCRRLNALASHADRLLIRVDAVIRAQPRLPCPGLLPLLGHVLRSALQSISGVVSQKSVPAAPLWRSPADLILGFPRVRRLEIELPGGDLRLEKGAVVRWNAEFGGRLRRCAILIARRITFASGSGGEDPAPAIEGGIKENVICTIGVLISASARHYVAMEVVRGRRKGCGAGGGGAVEEMEELVVRDRDGEGTLVMDREGLKECIHDGGVGKEGEGVGGRRGRRRTEVPAVRMRMRCSRAVEVGGGARMEEAALVVVRAAEEGVVQEEGMEADGWAAGAFEGAFRCAAEELLKRPSHSLEMNSF